MSIANLSAALSTQLQTIATANSYVVAWENQSYTPTASDTFLQEAIIPAETNDPALTVGYLDETGIYQVTVNTPLGGYKGTAQAIADTISAGFRRQILTYNSQKLEIRRVTINPALPSDGWYSVPISIEYRSIS